MRRPAGVRIWMLGQGKRLGMAVEEQSKELGDCKSRLKEKEEILEHYKRLLEESKDAMKEKESAMNRLKEVIEDRDGEIRRLKVVVAAMELGQPEVTKN
ncbi:unnamed protein product [Linum trigynum]|uniref:Uncharacterized protein n=2 Tax=Linum trigynum TaxID=586398 RepID=A0AAV2GP91_9ROSI